MTRSRASNFIDPSPPPPPPGTKPNISTGRPLDSSVYLAWTYPGSDVGAVTFTQIAVKLSGKPDVLRYVTFPAPAGETIVDNLENGQEYAFLFRAGNDSGYGPSNQVKVTPQDPVKPPKGTPRFLDASQPLDRSIYLSWKYDAADADAVENFGIEVKNDATGVVVKDVTIPAPTTDAIVDGLENGTKYAVKLVCWNRAGYCPGYDVRYFTPQAPFIAPPELLTIAPGDGLAKATYTPPASLPDGYTLRHIAYQATNTETGQITDGKTTGTPEAAVIPDLENDTNYHVQLVTVADPGPVLSALSNSLDVRPTKPIVPYPPVILDAYATEGGVLTVKWAPQDQPNGNTGPLDITAWRVRAHSADGKGADFSQEFPGETRTWAERKLTMGYWEVFVQAKNDIGWSLESNPVVVFYSYNYYPPLTGGGTEWETTTVKYLWCKADAKLQRTTKGANWPIRAALIGAGGGGKRQTLTGGKGGDGGGGELVIVDLPAPGAPGDVFVKVGRGADENSGDTPADTTVFEGGNTFTARSGRSATNKENAPGYGPVLMPEIWRDANAFRWNQPYSYTVGGVTTDGTPQFPNGYGPGQGGAGVKVNHAGNGEDGLVCFMWRKDGKPFDDPVKLEAPKRKRRWWRR